jgi:hypothetical protein
MTTLTRHTILVGFIVTSLGCVDRDGLDGLAPGVRTDGGPAGTGGSATGGSGGAMGGSGGAAGATGGNGGGAGRGGTGGASGGTGGASGGTGGTGGKKDGGTDAFVCGPVCAIFCEFGNVLDDHGCPTCRCNPPPVCPAIKCASPCPNGFEKDARGCATCQCNPPPADVCAPDACPAPRPASPNYICPDGKTVAGPACLHATDGTCHWQITTCPGSCVETVLCVIGDHFDSTLCRCVPSADAGASPSCACPNGDVCVKQIGGPAIPADPPTTCEPRMPVVCLNPSPCGCLGPNNGRCTPDATVQGLCICDNGIR